MLLLHPGSSCRGTQGYALTASDGKSNPFRSSPAPVGTGVNQVREALLLEELHRAEIGNRKHRPRHEREVLAPLRPGSGVRAAKGSVAAVAFVDAQSLCVAMLLV